MEDPSIVAAGRELPHAVDRIRRYCGLPWSGGPPETWAWHYYDAVPTEPDDAVTPIDVLCAGALHSGLSRADLAFFRDQRENVSAWLARVPRGLGLWETTPEVVDHLAKLPGRFEDVSVTILSKVLHRKRPLLIPLLDRHVIDWYRPVTGKRAVGESWDPIVRAMRNDALDEERRRRQSACFGEIEQELRPSPDADDRPRLSWIRAIDIAIWMGSR